MKGIEGVEKVDNQIEVLPVSPKDSRLRQALYRAIYGYPLLNRDAMPVLNPIRIVVKNGNVTLGVWSPVKQTKIRRAYPPAE